MILRITIVCLILCGVASSLSAQSVSLFDLDTSGYPTIKAKFYAVDAAGALQDPPASDVSISENGISRPVISITCPPPQAIQAVSSVLVMDISGSMRDGVSGVANIDVAKAAATYWITHLPLGMSECAITSFDDNNYFNQDFTTKQARLQSAIAGLGPQGGTDYDAALLLPVAGGLQVTTQAKYRKLIIFLTDGLPNREPQTAAIIAEAQRQNCLIYSVTLGLSCPQCLKDISLQTGGQWFENVVGQQQIVDIYQQIMAQVQGGSPCTISWMSTPSCASAETSVLCSWQNQSATANYMAPVTNAARLQCSPLVLSLRSKPMGIRFDTTITVTAKNAPYTVTNITSTNPTFDANPKAFQLAPGASKVVTLSFTPTDSDYTWSQFEIQTDQCPGFFFADGSYPGSRQSLSALRLTRPNGGEVYRVGSDTAITWTGVPMADTLSLSWSTDAGAHYAPITTQATNGRYPWHVPNTPSTQCLVRVAEAMTGSADGWAESAGGTQIDAGAGVAVDDAGNVYVTGYFTGTSNFGGIVLQDNQVTLDMFLAKYRKDGRIVWAKRLGGDQADRPSGIVVDHAQNVLFTGSFQGTADFGGQTMTSYNGTDAFVAKYAPDGSLQWAKHAGDRGSNPQTAGGASIAVDNANNIYLTGDFSGTADFGSTTVTSAGQSDGFVAKYSSDGTIQWVKRFGGASADWGTGIAVDGIGNCYLTGGFKSTADFGGITLSSNGDFDIFVAKFHPDGNIAWARGAGGSDLDRGIGISLDAAGNAYATGSFQQVVNFGTHPLMSHGGEDIFVVKYNAVGTVQWAERAGGPDDDLVGGIVATPSGNAYVTGMFGSTSDFGTSSLTSLGFINIFVAKYLPDGSVDWAKRAGGTGADYGTAICADASENIYSTGAYHNRSDFGSHTLTESAGGEGDVYTWKIGADAVQSDTSDATFSIVVPEPMSSDVDMGSVVLSQSKDSVVQTFIRNTGTFSFRVDSISLFGPDASQFVIVSGIPPFDVPAGGTHRVEFYFAPSTVGPKSATIRIFLQSDTLLQTITGIGITPVIKTDGNVIDFGERQIGSVKDTLIALAINNIGGSSIDFTSLNQLGPDVTQFSVQSGGTPFTLTPGASRTVTLRFAPKYVGRTSGRIGFAFNGVGSPAVLTVFGQGLGGRVRLPDDSGYPGDHRAVPMILEEVSASSLQSVATNFKAKIAYDASVLFPTSGTIAHGNGFDTLSIGGSIGTDSLLMRIPFVAMLGRSSTSPMSIVDFQWLDGSGTPADYDAEAEGGTFKLLGLCPAGGARLFDPNGTVSLTHVTPNPTSASIHIDITTTELGRTRLVIQDLLGQTVATVFDGEVKPGVHSFDENVRDLPSGSYYLTLTTPTVRRIQRIDISK